MISTRLVTRHLSLLCPSLPFQPKAKVVNLSHVGLFALGVGRAVRADAARGARAVEGELAGRAVELRARSPEAEAPARERRIGCGHAPAHRAEARVVRLRKESRRNVRAEVLAQYAPLAPEREDDDDEHPEEG